MKANTPHDWLRTLPHLNWRRVISDVLTENTSWIINGTTSRCLELVASGWRKRRVFFFFFRLKHSFSSRGRNALTQECNNRRMFSLPLEPIVALVQSLAIWFILFTNFSSVLGSDSQAILLVLFSLPCLEKKTAYVFEKVRYLINFVCIYCSYLLYSSSSSSGIKKNIFVYLLSHRHMFSLLVLERSSVFLFVKNWMKNWASLPKLPKPSINLLL